jgi:plasmid stabilization system protein ParE
VLPLEFEPDASDEVRQVFDWYESQLPGLGEEFLDNLGDALMSIVQTPGAWPKYRRGTRRRRLHRFPYGIVYRTEKDFIRVFAVMHLSRRSGYWFDRL